MSVAPKQALTDQARRKPLYYWIALLLGTVLLGMYLFAGLMISRYGTMAREFGWKAARRDGQWVVVEVDPQGAAAGTLQTGDVILSINGDDRVARIDSNYVWFVEAGQDAYALEVQRGGEQSRLELQTTRRHSYRILGAILSNLAASLGFCVVGLVLGLIKPEDRITRRASLTLLAFASFTLYISLSE